MDIGMSDVWDVCEPWKCGPLYLGMHRDEFVEHVGFEGKIEVHDASGENFHSEQYQLDVGWTPGKRLEVLLVCRQTPMTILGQQVLGRSIQEAVDALSSLTPLWRKENTSCDTYLPDLGCSFNAHDPDKGYLEGMHQIVTEVYFAYTGLGSLDDDWECAK